MPIFITHTQVVLGGSITADCQNFQGIYILFNVFSGDIKRVLHRLIFLGHTYSNGYFAIVIVSDRTIDDASILPGICFHGLVYFNAVHGVNTVFFKLFVTFLELAEEIISVFFKVLAAVMIVEIQIIVIFDLTAFFSKCHFDRSGEAFSISGVFHVSPIEVFLFLVQRNLDIVNIAEEFLQKFGKQFSFALCFYFIAGPFRFQIKVIKKKAAQKQ